MFHLFIILFCSFILFLDVFSLRFNTRHANLKYKYGSRHFWAKGYFCDTVGKNEKVIREYIQTQLQEDKLYDQMSMKEFIDPFTGEPVKKGRK